MSENLGAIVSNTDPAEFPGPEPLTGRHVTLERLAQKHFPGLYESIGSHPDVWLYWPDEPPDTRAKFEEYLNGMFHISDDVVVYPVIPLSTLTKGKAVGLAFAQSEHRQTNRVAELGMFFGPELQRTKEGTEAAYLLAGLLFKLNHRRLQWKTNSLNHRSRKAAERYGFVYEGTFRQDQINKGRNRDSAWYSIIDSEWPTCSKAFEEWLEDANFDEQWQQRRKLEEVRESIRQR